MAKMGAVMNLDMDKFVQSSNPVSYSPHSVMDVMKNVVPFISTMISLIRRNYNMYPTYLVSGLRTASMLRSMQSFVTKVPDLRGEVGFTGETAQFLQLKVLESPSINDNKMYLSTKAPNNSLEKSTIVDFVYQPLYIVSCLSES